MTSTDLGTMSTNTKQAVALLLLLQLVLSIVGGASVWLTVLSGPGCGHKEPACDFHLYNAAATSYLILLVVFLAGAAVGSWALRAKGRLAIMPPIAGIALVIMGTLFAHALITSALRL